MYYSFLLGRAQGPGRYIYTAALRGRILHHFLKKVSFHSNKKEDLPGLPSLSLCKDTK